jgi:macrolide transport system ATP-binding/permease protein
MVLARQLHAAFPDQHPWSEVSVYPLNGIDPHRRSEHSRLIVVLGTTATMLLVIACANLAALLLSRGLQRSREIATRFALGAGRGRVIRQLLTESIVLALVGGLAGLLVASWFAALLENHYPLPLDVHIDRQTAAFNTLLAVVAGLAFGLVPALRSSRLRAVRIREAMASPSITRSLLWSAFVVLQIGLSVVLVAGAGLLIQSRAALMEAPGFDPSNVIYLQMKPHLSGYDAVKERAYFAEVQRRLASLAGVQSIAFAFRPPLRGQELPEVPVSLPGDESAAPERALRVKHNVVSPSFFETLAVPILRGRGFETRDLETARAVVVVNDVLAGRLWPGREATGQTLLVAGKPHDVAGIVRYDNFRRSGEAPAPFLFRAGQAGNRMLVRVARDPEAMLPLLRREIRAIDPGVAITAETPFASVLQDSFAPVTLTAIALGSAGGIAVALTVLGLYGVLAVAVAQRTREIGIRMALGATTRAVVTMVIRDGTRLLMAGLALGTTWAVVSAGRLSDYLYGVTGRDPLTFATAAIVLAVVGLLACYLPARYAARIDPVRTLRSE